MMRNGLWVNSVLLVIERLMQLGRKCFERISTPKFIFDGAMDSHVGRVRSENEDSVAFTMFDERSQLRHAGLLAVVADGMGGHSSGEVASLMAVETVMTVYVGAADYSPRAALVRGFEESNRAMLAASKAQPELDGMGTTCTALALCGRYAYVAHVGDSRAYRWREGRLDQLTDDHTLVGQWVKQGLISEADAEVHPDRSVIVKALGLEHFQPDWVSMVALPMKRGDIFCLCSDGLSNMVDADTIGRTISSLAPAQACLALRSEALNAGGLDNISIGIFRVLSIKDAMPVFAPPKITKANFVGERAN